MGKMYFYFDLCTKDRPLREIPCIVREISDKDDIEDSQLKAREIALSLVPKAVGASCWKSSIIEERGYNKDSVECVECGNNIVGYYHEINFDVDPNYDEIYGNEDRPETIYYCFECIPIK